MEKTNQDFENEYSRQIGAYGMETMGKLIKLEALIVGLRGLGVETAKNLILAGPKKVHIYDPNPVTIKDLGSNFYLNEKDLGKRRDEACINKLKELNPRCDVDFVKDDIYSSPSKVADFHVVIVTEVHNTSLIKAFDESVRQKGGAFIYASAVGVSGYVFSDFGKEFSIRDPNGEECKMYVVKTISNDKQGIVMIDDTSGGKIAYEDGDYVTFKEVQGMTQLNDGVPRQIKYISPFAFSIGDTSSYGEYISGGIVEQVKVPKPVNYRSFEEAYETPYPENSQGPDPTDFSKFGRNELLHTAFRALHSFNDKNGKLPEQNDLESIKPFVEEAKKFYEENKESKHWLANGQAFDEKIVQGVLRWAKSSIVPVTSFMGGIVAQEAIKFTGKFTPINQWLWFDFFESVANIPETADRTAKNSRYDDQIAIIGAELQQKLLDLKIFMVGAGALGCEFLKEFALMGISCGKGHLTVTDNDHIEISNLNRQFLFRINDVKKPKSLIASQAALSFNPDFKNTSLQTLVTPENEHIFNENFWTEQDYVINAVDNIKARKYIDNQCTFFKRPLIDSGTLGTKAHSQVIYPKVTSCYNDKQDPVEDSIPMCTLHNFPSMIEHCIEYGRDAFTGNFSDVFHDVQKYLKNPSGFIEDVKKEGNTTVHVLKLTSVKNLLNVAQSGSFDRCIELAFQAYTSLFDHKIRQLLYNFPPDFKNNDGSKFWVGSKRVPSPIPYNADDELCLTYVATYAILTAQSLSIQPLGYDYIKNYSRSLQIPEFTPQKVVIKVNDNDPESNDQGQDADDRKLKEVITALAESSTNSITSDRIIPQEFEKDDDTNHHIDFIHSCSNLRARNYTIGECDRLKTKLIAGKIVPAIATTTASITGLVALQIITTLQTDKIDFMRDGYINLGVNIYLLTEPGPKIEHQDKDYDPILLSGVKAIPPKWSVWDTIEINQSMTVKEMIDYYDKTYNVDISVIAFKNLSLYMAGFPNSKERLNEKIEDLYVKLAKCETHCSYILLDISADTKEGDIAVMPQVKYKFK